jgi:Ca2+-binding EF-hand superfamily protein
MARLFKLQEELKEMVENVDTDGSGSIEFLEFLLLMGKILNDSPNQEDLRNIFTGQVFRTLAPPPLLTVLSF